MAIYNNRLNASFNSSGGNSLPSILGIGLALLLIAIIFMFRPNQPADGGGDEGPEVASANETPSVAATAEAEDTPVVAVTSPATETPSTDTDNVTPAPPTEQEPTSVPDGAMTSTPVATFTPASSNPTEDPDWPEDDENEQNEDSTPVLEPTFTLPPSATVVTDQEEKTGETLTASPTELPASATIAYEQEPTVSIVPTEAPSTETAPTDTPASVSPTPTVPPTIPPTVPPTIPPTILPTVPPTIPPTVPPTIPPTVPPTIPPTVPPTIPPTVPPTIPPTVPPTAVPRNVTLTLLSPPPDEIMKTHEVRFSFELTGIISSDRWEFKTGLDSQVRFNERNRTLEYEGSGVFYTDLNYRPGHTDGNGFGKDYYWQIIIKSEDGTVLATSEIRKFRWEQP